MSQYASNLTTGFASALIAFGIGVFTFPRTNALVLPAGVPLFLWDAVVVFGVGVTLVALIVHLFALTLLKPKPVVALMGFLIGFLGCMVVGGTLQGGIKMLLAALVGALLATAIATLRSNNSFKPKPLRGSA